MIEALELENFQSHKYSLLTFSPGVNVIKGQSDAGKSVIIRALRWVILGKPLGSTMMRWGESKTRVAISFTDGSFIEKTRTGTKNQYRCTGVDGVLEAMKSEVPSEVLSIAQMGELNIRSQGDGHFLIDDTPGEVARKLNEAADLGIINVVLPRSLEKIKEIVRQKSENDNAASETQRRIAELDYVAGAEKRIKKIDSLLADRDFITEQRAAIEKQKVLVEEKKEEAIQLAEVIEGLEPRLLPLISKADRLEQKRSRRQQLWGTVSRIHEDRMKLDSIRGKLRSENTIKGLLEKAGYLEEIKQKRAQLKSIVEYVQMKRTQAEKLGYEATEQEKALSEAFKSLRICPLCGRPL